jgi:two-component system, response regulator PdtaR
MLFLEVMKTCMINDFVRCHAAGAMDGQLAHPLAHPLQVPPLARQSEPSRGAGRSVSARKLRVIVVEDEFIIALELEMLLAELGVEVVGSANTGEKALALAASAKPDFVTMDIKLPGDLDGISTAVEMYGRHGIRSIFVSAYKDAELFERAQQAKPLGWVRKPVSLGALRAVLPTANGMH